MKLEPHPVSPPSPCVRRCNLDAQGERCIGCLRTLDEIARWSSMGNDERWQVLAAIAQRAATVAAPLPEQP